MHFISLSRSFLWHFLYNFPYSKDFLYNRNLKNFGKMLYVLHLSRKSRSRLSLLYFRVAFNTFLYRRKPSSPYLFLKYSKPVNFFLSFNLTRKRITSIHSIIVLQTFRPQGHFQCSQNYINFMKLYPKLAVSSLQA